ARKVDGGCVLRGSWPFSSGVNCSEWNMLASVVSSEDDADGIEYRIFLLPKGDYRIKDTWDAAGLRGTGSNDVEVADAFVADHMTVGVHEVARKTKKKKRKQKKKKRQQIAQLFFFL